MKLSEKIKIKKKKKFREKYKIGLCLSGGGVRGFAHMGAFKAFEEYGIKFDMVAGTSAGSLFGMLYASNYSYADMYKLTNSIKTADFKKSKLGFLPSKMDLLQNLIQTIAPVEKLEQLPIPLFVVAVDIRTGREMDFSTGSIAPILAGSCAVPYVFYPVKYKDMLLVDGGVLNNIPADVLRENGCDFVITIDCNCARGQGTTSNKFTSQLSACFGIMLASNSKNGIKNSDIVICPKLSNYNFLKLKEKDAIIQEGYDAVIRILPEIEKLLMGEYRKKW